MENTVGLRDLTLLVAEDSDFQRETLVAVLGAMGATDVLIAENGKIALDVIAARKASVNVLITDLEMPEMDGLELIRHAGEIGFRGAVMIASALDENMLASAEAMAKAYGINFLGAFRKPLTRKLIEEAMQQYGVPEPKLHAPSPSRRAYKAEEILAAIKQDQFEPFFQPKVELSTRRVVGAEALARWRHPTSGLIFPGAFVPVLEQTGNIDELTWLMLRKAIVFCGTLNTLGLTSTVAINLSLKSLENVELAARIAAVVERHALDPHSVCIEITESAAMSNVGPVLENLTRLRMAGFGLSIDDFGTGYSSMEQLTRVPFTELKIDRSFVINAIKHEPARVMLTSSLQIARQLKLQAVAEGVETQEEWDLLVELGCDYAQGYFIGRPMQASMYIEWLQELGTTPTSMFTSPMVRSAKD
jgi:EAL domain-containing protein (putative c-di-GMP-specific phosphodiesterase class I)/FixJ family two-component response regulator